MASPRRFPVCVRWERRNGWRGHWRFPGRVRREWSALDFRARNLRYARVPGLPFLWFGPTYGSFVWRLLVLPDEVSHAELRPCLVGVAEIAMEAVRRS